MAGPTPPGPTPPGGPAIDWARSPDRADRTVIDLEPDSLPAWAGQLLADGYRLALVAAHDDDASAPGGQALRVVYLFTAGPPDSRVELHVRLHPRQPEVPTLAALSFPAGRFEREMHDLYGVVPVDHPQPRRLVHPEGPFPFLTVEGPGVYEIPVGPVHAGLIEPGHFRFSVVGETILKLKARLWFVHKGIEKLFEHRSPADALPLAERISGDTTVGHALAYCLAVEDATGWPVPPEAVRKRAILLELERLYNHTTDLGALCNDVGHGILHAHAMRIREQLLRLNAQVTGHRLLRGGVHLGGATLHTVPDPAHLRALAADIAEIVDLALGHTVVADRFTGTAIPATSAPSATSPAPAACPSTPATSTRSATSARPSPPPPAPAATSWPASCCAPTRSPPPSRSSAPSRRPSPRAPPAPPARPAPPATSRRPAPPAASRPQATAPGGHPASASSRAGGAPSPTGSNSTPTAPSPEQRSSTPRSSTGRPCPSP